MLNKRNKRIEHEFATLRENVSFVSNRQIELCSVFTGEVGYTFHIIQWDSSEGCEIVYRSEDFSCMTKTFALAIDKIFDLRK